MWGPEISWDWQGTSAIRPVPGLRIPGTPMLHLFYRGPVAIAPLLGKMLASAKPLVVYQFEGGRYFPAYTMDRQFLYLAVCEVGRRLAEPTGMACY